MKNFILFLSLCGLLMFFPGCNKVEGPGGQATIIGEINVVYKDAAGNILKEYVGAKEDVFIIYGGTSTVQNDDTESSHDGSFEFNYLETGVYQVFIYEELPAAGNAPGEKGVVILDLEITDKKQVVDLGIIDIDEYI